MGAELLFSNVLLDFFVWMWVVIGRFIVTGDLSAVSTGVGEGNLDVGEGLMSVVIPACGTSGGVDTYVSSLLIRACSGVSVVIVSSNSASGALRMLGSCCSLSGQVEVVPSPRDNMSSAEGHKVRSDGKACVAFISTSSCISGSLVSGCIGLVSGSGISLTLYNVFRSSLVKGNDISMRILSCTRPSLGLSHASVMCLS